MHPDLVDGAAAAQPHEPERLAKVSTWPWEAGMLRGFVERPGKGSHRNFTHPSVRKPLTLSGALGSDAKQYQEKAVRLAIEESKR